MVGETFGSCLHGKKSICRRRLVFESLAFGSQIIESEVHLRGIQVIETSTYRGNSIQKSISIPLHAIKPRASPRLRLIIIHCLDKCFGHKSRHIIELHLRTTLGCAVHSTILGVSLEAHLILIGIEIVEPSIDDEAGIALRAVERDMLVRSSIGTCATRCADADK